MRIINPKLGDMMEIYYGHPRQVSRNEIARHMAKISHIPRSAGSDFHVKAMGGPLEWYYQKHPETLEVLKIL